MMTPIMVPYCKGGGLIWALARVFGPACRLLGGSDFAFRVEYGLAVGHGCFKQGCYSV